jgi:hypothetical protein
VKPPKVKSWLNVCKVIYSQKRKRVARRYSAIGYQKSALAGLTACLGYSINISEVKVLI